MNQTKLGLTTRACRRELRIDHHTKPEETITVATDLEIVTGITLPDGTTYNNRRHSAEISLRTLLTAKRSRTESITLPDEKASRLVALFRKLRPGHELECHNVFAEVELWPDIINQERHARILDTDEAIVGGTPYCVESNFGTEDNGQWVYTHSCLGTDNGNLLGIVGEGMMLAVMDRENTERLYARGGVPYLAAVTLDDMLGAGNPE